MSALAIIGTRSGFMNVAYIVSAYKRPEQLARLLSRLATDRASFVVHVDRKTDGRVYAEMVRGTSDLPAVHFLARHNCHWGGWGHVRATLKGIRHVVSNEIPFQYAVLLTGQDYPLRPPEAIESFLAEAEGRSFMRHWPLPFQLWEGRGGLDRIESWHATWYRHMHLRVPLRRRVPGGLTPYGGGAYWCLSRPVVEYIHRFTQSNPRFMRFFEHVFIPDELFFQTIVMNSTLADTVVNDHLRYLDWSRQPAPAILETHDFGALVASGKLFARKFDVAVDAEILDLIDRQIEQEARALPGHTGSGSG